MILKLAWRNIWRNKRRTYITLASVFFAVILSTLMMSLKEGVYVNMIQSMIGSYMGFGQVHSKGYWEEKTIDYSFQLNDSLKSEVSSVKGIDGYLERIESFAMAASDSVTKVAMVVGISVEKETLYNQLNTRVVEGEYLKKDDHAIMLGYGLAKKLKVGVGDTLVLLGQGYRGATAAGKYNIKGLVKFGSPELSKMLVFLPLREANWFYGMENQVNNLILQFKDPDKASESITALVSKLENTFEVMGWEELAPELKNMIETDRMEGYVLMFILYLVIGFGIFGTTLMMLAERAHEFGVLVAIGMKRYILAIMVWAEVVILSIVGALIGMLGAFPIAYYFYKNPIRLSDDLQKMTEEYGLEAVLQFSVEPTVFLQQGMVIALLASVIGLYPFFKLMRINAINNMRR